MRAVIAGSLIDDGEAGPPRPGSVLRSLALFVLSVDGAIETSARLTTVRGVVLWARVDDAAQVTDLVIDAGGWSVLAQVDEADLEEPVELGSQRVVEGQLRGVGATEARAGGRPDATRDWMVTSAVQNEETSDWHVDITVHEPSGGARVE